MWTIGLAVSGNEIGLPPNPMSTKLYLSLAHTEREIEAFLDVARVTLRVDCRG